MPVRFDQLLKLTILACTGILFTGCASVFPKLNSSNLPTESVENTAQTANYYVEMHPVLGKPKVFEGQITKPTTVQMALEESGAIKEFSAMMVDVHRLLPNGTTHKLPVEFKKGKQVKYEQDYALHPNDRVVVTAKSNSPLDKLVEQVFGEL